jgi:putative endonuclease
LLKLRSPAASVGKPAYNYFMWYYVYILKNKFGKQYIGATEDLETRLKEHNEGSVIATKKGRPWQIEWHCSFRDKKKAYDFERYLKSGSGSSIRYRHLVPK